MQEYFIPSLFRKSDSRKCSASNVPSPPADICGNLADAAYKSHTTPFLLYQSEEICKHWAACSKRRIAGIFLSDF